MVKVPSEVYKVRVVSKRKYASCSMYLLEDSWEFDLKSIHLGLKNRFPDLKLQDIWVSKIICYVARVQLKDIPSLIEAILDYAVDKAADEKAA